MLARRSGWERFLEDSHGGKRVASVFTLAAFVVRCSEEARESCCQIETLHSPDRSEQLNSGEASEEDDGRDPSNAGERRVGGWERSSSGVDCRGWKRFGSRMADEQAAAWAAEESSLSKNMDRWWNAVRWTPPRTTVPLRILRYTLTGAFRMQAPVQG